MLRAATKSWIPRYCESLPHIDVSLCPGESIAPSVGINSIARQVVKYCSYIQLLGVIPPPMNFLIVRRRERGVAIPSERLSKIQPVKGDIHILESHSQALGRPCVQAWIFKSDPGPDVFPRLLDAKVNGMAQLGMNINGVEEVDGALYAQSWWCRIE